MADFFAGLIAAVYYLPLSNFDPELPKSLLRLNQVLIEKTVNMPELKDDYWLDKMRDKAQPTMVEKEIVNLADDADIQRIFFNQKKPYSLTYYPDFYYYLKDWFYIYSADDYTEETKVPSIKQAIEQLRDKSIYHFCEPADHPHWFVCVSED
ncbi:hypothetical protein [Vibrio quintilis]|uniref:Uncharacterized protein n=1 Tax=Vibrio quintilis TaxID=1117707 RepID=A0A1M7YNX4_9VIBR|nr:hypothetical protein [Vibrio quintilis]SHO54342.1 hypothetical protein VQ7734_00056 [Vibrio quintilis]